MNLEYKEKYLKYKKKYTNLKLELEGGKPKPLSNADKDNRTETFYLFTSDGIYNKVALYKGKILTDDPPVDILEDSKIELPIVIYKKNSTQGGYVRKNIPHIVHAIIEYLEKKYGGRFDKNGNFKKGAHLDKKGKYLTFKSGMFSHYPEYFGELKPWTQTEIDAGKIKPVPILLNDGDNIYLNEKNRSVKLDFYRKVLFYGIKRIIDGLDEGGEKDKEEVIGIFKARLGDRIYKYMMRGIFPNWNVFWWDSDER